MMSEKIRPHHLERKAILYVRQSSAHQVLHNRESSALQYAMRDRLTALGWSLIPLARHQCVVFNDRLLKYNHVALTVFDRGGKHCLILYSGIVLRYCRAAVGL
jgi:hypothetical protein